MSRKSGRRKPMAEINVVPYIDVTLVLLIIFMITTPLLQSGVDVDLPVADAKTVDATEESPIIIAINKDGLFFITSNDQQEEPVQEEDILIQVTAIIRNKPKTPVYIKGDNQVDYGKVVTIMAALKNAGVPGVGLMTRPKQ